MKRTFTDRKLDHVAFPMGGIGGGMICLEGNGSFGSASVRNAPNIYLEPNMFACVAVKGDTINARVLQGQVPLNKIFGGAVHGFFGEGMGLTYKNYGLPRFRKCEFSSRFPFANISLEDATMPFDVQITGWSPFIPTDADASSLPAASVKYTLKNKTDAKLDAVFSFSALQFMGVDGGDEKQRVRPIKNGFVLEQKQVGEDKSTYGAFAISTDLDSHVDADLYRGGWWDSFTMLWNSISSAEVSDKTADDLRSPGGMLSIPFAVDAGGEYSVTVNMNWYVPDSSLRVGFEEENGADKSTYRPWYAGKYDSIEAVVEDYSSRYNELLSGTKKFTDAFYNTNLPDDVTEAVAANLSIIKSPTILRQTDGKLWGWEGCCDTVGSCEGTCQHVWNYAQAICHLFASLERGIRDTEFTYDMDERGHQQFRTALPIRKNGHGFRAASDGQLGSIMKMYREWRVSGDTEWIKSYWDKIVLAMDYCIKTWDPDELGAPREPRHNTYDIEFWGADGMCSSFYLGALKAAAEIGGAFGKDTERYELLYRKGREYLETKLWNGEYFYQIPEWKTLKADFDDGGDEILKNEGPKYQYGGGCLSDGVLGAWIAKQCGLGDILDPEKTKKHLLSVYKYNFRRNLYDHANPQRPGYALGADGGLLVCSWPHGGKPSIPLVYSDEVWTGMEYQVAAHLASFGCIKESTDIIKTLRARYDGERRNPYDEYECGHWYVRALASYGLIEAYTGVRYDAVTKTLFAKRGNHTAFLSAATGFGTVTVNGDSVEFKPSYGNVDIRETKIID